MTTVELKRDDEIAYREAAPVDAEAGAPVLLVHGFPESSYMWRGVMPAIAESGRRAIAPDLPGYGDSAPDPPGSWERQVDAVEAFRSSLDLDRVVLVVHDWGGLIGLRWACEHPEAIAGLVLSDTGFFPDGEWHGMAQMLRSEDGGEELVEAINRDLLAATLQGMARGITDEAIDEYMKAFATPEGRQGVLELYRSGDFEKCQQYQETLSSFSVPVLALWGEDDEFAPPAGAYRFRDMLPQTSIVVVESAGHFVYEDAPERCSRELAGFLATLDE